MRRSLCCGLWLPGVGFPAKGMGAVELGLQVHHGAVSQRKVWVPLSSVSRCTTALVQYSCLSSASALHPQRSRTWTASFLAQHGEPVIRGMASGDAGHSQTAQRSTCRGRSRIASSDMHAAMPVSTRNGMR